MLKFEALELLNQDSTAVFFIDPRELRGWDSSGNHRVYDSFAFIDAIVADPGESVGPRWPQSIVNKVMLDHEILILTHDQ